MVFGHGIFHRRTVHKNGQAGRGGGDFFHPGDRKGDQSDRDQTDLPADGLKRSGLRVLQEKRICRIENQRGFFQARMTAPGQDTYPPPVPAGRFNKITEADRETHCRNAPAGFVRREGGAGPGIPGFRRAKTRRGIDAVHGNKRGFLHRPVNIVEKRTKQ